MHKTDLQIRRLKLTPTSEIETGRSQGRTICIFRIDGLTFDINQSPPTQAAINQAMIAHRPAFRMHRILPYVIGAAFLGSIAANMLIDSKVGAGVLLLITMLAAMVFMFNRAQVNFVATHAVRMFMPAKGAEADPAWSLPEAATYMRLLKFQGRAPVNAELFLVQELVLISETISDDQT